MNTTVESAEPSTGGRKRPWAALAVLGVALLAVIGAMVHVQTRPVEPNLVVLPDSESVSPDSVNTVIQTTTPATDTVKIGNPVVAPR